VPVVLYIVYHILNDFAHASPRRKHMPQ
jgi:hypothetical protein